jgi:lysyl-tRNA synthetase class II
MLESYEAYADYHDVMDLTEALLQRAAGGGRHHSS